MQYKAAVSLAHSYWRYSRKVMKTQRYNYLVILDFEATCERGQKIEPQEIIEFPCMKVNSSTFKVESIFHKYICPTKPLTSFCTELTGITQEMVENESPFKEVFAEFLHWLEEEHLWDAPMESVFVTCGDWDLKTMLPNQCQQLNIPVPPRMTEWVNIKKAFAQVMGIFPKRDIPDMLKILGLPLQGRLHSGIDDCKNIHTIACELLKHNYIFSPTSSWNP